jgi:hypothetical protein
MSCSNCNTGTPIGCGCGSPCADAPVNTAANESLQSQIENFTLAFFGTVVKTEVNGEVTWSLPCNLDVGLENNPRADGEGLACYFLRLFRDGITGLTGPKGDTGASGADGHNAYTVTLVGFTQPTIGSPYVTVVCADNPAILAGLYVFIQTSGWYFVNSVSAGLLSLTLVKAVDSPPSTVSAGKLVVSSGFPGASIVGPAGPQGTKGDTGTPGTSFTSTHARYVASVGTDYNLQVVYQAIDFVNSAPALLLPVKGAYLVTAIVDVEGLAGVNLADVVSIKLYNQTNASDVEGTEHSISNLVVDQFAQVVVSITMDTDGDNQTVAIFGKCSTADKVKVIALKTTFSYVRLS